MDNNQIVNQYYVHKENKSYPKYLTDSIRSLTHFLPVKTPLGQRIWHLENNMLKIFICKYCNKQPAKWGEQEIRKNNKRIKSFMTYTTCGYSGCKKTRHLESIINKFKDSNYKKKHKKGSESVNWKKVYEKVKITNLKIYGVDNPGKLQSTKNKWRERMLSKFSKDYLPDGYEHIGWDNKDSDLIIYKHFKCKNVFQIRRNQRDYRIFSDVELCTICNHKSKSKYEDAIEQWLISEKINFKKNYRDGGGYELDFYLPDNSIGIEHNGLYWHSHLFKDKSYHKDKMTHFNDKGIRVIQFWEDEWHNSSIICKSIIKNAINKIEIKVYARKLKITYVNNSLASDFYTKFHLQGHVSATTHIALKGDNGIIYQLMSFTKWKHGYELIRMAVKSNCSVIGGANRLFKNYVSKEMPDLIYSFADLRIFTGGVYDKLGFSLEYTISPRYYYVKNGYPPIRHHRRNFQKHKLVAAGHDPNKTEFEIMCDLGYLRVHDCGNTKWIWKK